MKFNVLKRWKNRTRNYEGAPAFLMTPEMEFYTAVVTTALSDSFYETDSDRLLRIQQLIAKTDPEFVAKLAVYAREKMHLRSVPLVLAVELAKLQSGNPLVSRMTARVVKRADEITELLAYYAKANQRTGEKQLGKLSKQLQKGLAEAFNRFDAYQFAKYDREGMVTLRDALFLVHPKPKNAEQQMIFDQIAKKTLAVPYTWEVELSKLGQQKFAGAAEKKLAVKNKWEELIFSGQLGYMALLRNLRNILMADVSAAAIDKVSKTLSDADAVQKSKQLPFRFLAAYRELRKIENGFVPVILRALENAVQESVAQISGFDMNTRVVIACDVSRSMMKPVSAKSKIQLYDIGLLLGMIMHFKSKHVITGIFGTNYKTVRMANTNILSCVDAFYQREGEVGYSTNGHLVIDRLLDKKYVADKVMLFTDLQLWNSTGMQYYDGNAIRNSWQKYKKFAPMAKLYLFDLAGYGTSPLRLEAGDVFLIAGWSDKIFDVLSAIENGKSAIDMIIEMEV